MAQYLSKINWQLKDLSFISKTKLNIEFIFNGFEFNVELDLLTYFKENRQSFNVFRIIESGLLTSKILLRISANKGRLILSDIPETSELKGLLRLFEKIALIESNPENLKNTLQEGIRTELQNEFEFINVIIYNLINKLGIIKIPENIVFYQDDSEPVIIEKITTVHDRRFSE